MKFRIIYNLVLLIIFYGNAVYSQTISINGTVTDEENKTLPFVNVYLINSTDGAMTDDDGSFSFLTSNKGRVTLVASMIGYRKFEQVLDLSNNKLEYKLTISLKENIYNLDEAIVIGSAFSSEEGKGIVLKSMDVMTTPGGAADIFQSLKTMPGLTQVSESAELFVRGGDPTETITIIDQASIYHPYTYESAYGGLFSNLNTSAMKGLFFSSGGFSSKYGNVLSGVLDIETKDEPLSMNYSLGVSVASVSASAEVPILDNQLGIRVYGQQSFTKPIMWLNGDLDDFSVSPSSKNLTANLVYNYSSTGKFKLFGLFADDKQGVNIERAEFTGDFMGNSNNTFLNLQHSEILFSEVFAKSSLSYNKHDNYWNLGILDLKKSDRVIKFRTDIEYKYSSRINILSGFEFENRTQNYLGTIPNEDYDFRNNADGEYLNESLIGSRIGFYSELENSNFLSLEKLFVIGGVRFDYIPEINNYWIDPRFGFGYKLNTKSTIKLAYGFFHQLPETRLLVPVDGNPNLEPMKATHYVLSFEHEIDNQNNFRMEVYHKEYKSLPLEDELLNYNNNGFGFANGLDAVFKGQFPFNIDGWISYGYINTKRKWMDFRKLSTSDFDISHNFTIVAKYNLNSMWQIGLNYKYATGRPYTPVIGSNFLVNKNIYEPIYGLKNSKRSKNYQRLDFRITHLNQLFGKYFTVVYLEALNILNINNLFGYTFNKDYSERKIVKSYFGRRTIVIGLQISL